MLNITINLNRDSPLADWQGRMAAFDLETTGLDLAESRIVTACVAELGPNGELASTPQEWLINPGVPIPKQATDVHGITDQLAQSQGIPPQRAIAEIVKVLNDFQQQGVPIAIFNAPYDLTLLRSESNRYGLNPPQMSLIVDPLVLDRKFMQFRRGKRTLTVLADAFGVELLNAHNSTADAIAAGQLAQIMVSRFVDPGVSASELHSLQISWSDEQTASLESFVRQANPGFVASYGWPAKN